MIITFLILLVVLILIVFRPRNLNIAWPTTIGAILVMIFGFLTFEDIKTIFFDTWDASFTLIALFLLAEIFNANKFFDWAALHLAKKSAGSGWKLYIYSLILTTLATAFLANDGAILILTPIFATLLKKIYPQSKKDWLPYIFATGFFADSMSAILIPSNLTNILIADSFKLNFEQVFLKMFLPMTITFIVGALCFGIRFKKRLEVPYKLTTLSSPNKVIKDWFTFWLGLGIFVLLIVGYFIGGRFHLPIALIALPLAILMLGVVHFRKLISAHQVLKVAPWNILVYALGMFMIITASYNTDLLNFVTTPLQNFAQGDSENNLFQIGLIVGALSAVTNNLPTTLVGILTLKQLSQISESVLYAVMLGVNIGPKLTPFGSLSTLLWLGLLEKNGINISWKEYIKENWWITILVLISALLGLNLELLFKF